MSRSLRPPGPAKGFPGLTGRPWLAVAVAVAAATFGAASPAAAISGGHPALQYRFGFVRYLRLETSDGKTGGCTGTLISERRVLTAAHCVVDRVGTPVRAIEIRRTPEDAAGIPATAAYVHAGFETHDKGAFYSLNDLAILELRDKAAGPTALTPVEYLWRNDKNSVAGRVRPDFVAAIGADDARPALDRVLSRDASGRPYAAQVGFGLVACDRKAGCERPPSGYANVVLKYLFNYRVDRPIVTQWCDPGAFSFAAPERNLICSSHDQETTLSAADQGPSGVYGTQQGDSGGPAIVFDKEGRPFVIGVNSFGRMDVMSVHMNLVEHLDFLREAELGTGPTIRKVSFAPGPQAKKEKRKPAKRSAIGGRDARG